MKQKMTRQLLFGMFSIVAVTTYATNITSINHGFYVLGEAGASFSNSENFGIPANSIDWSRPQDDLSGRIGNSPLLGAGIGYSINSLLSADLTYTQRWNFKYDRSFIAADRARSFDLNNQTVLASVYLHADGLNHFDWGRFDPYIGAGIGEAWNRTSNFSSRVISTGEDATRFTTGYYKNANGFAWQLTAGTNFALTDKWALGVGYRYLNMGKAIAGIQYESTDNSQRPRDPLKANSLSAQEVYLNLMYHFAAV